jgi:hypothetical protein
MSIVLSKNYPALRPSAVTRFFRTFLPWQIIRFIIVNIRMTSMILKSHDKKQITLT